jgi:hypothetical protein
MMIIRNLTLAFLAFLATAFIAGQIIMRGQGDTPEISMKYGLLYVIYGCGIPQTISSFRSGEFSHPFVTAVIIQLAAD